MVGDLLARKPWIIETTRIPRSAAAAIPFVD
jgi:hypothetical protein